jgi:uncharacterized RDD family membrane protein YckC
MDRLLQAILFNTLKQLLYLRIYKAVQGKVIMVKSNPVTSNSAGLFRRLFAIIYDSFLLIAIMFVASAIEIAFNHGKAIQSGDAIYPYYLGSLVFLSYLYFAWFWTHGGQTLGMKTWRLKLVAVNGTPLNWQTAAIRYCAALLSWGFLALGFIWSLVDSENRCWHDMISKTRLIDTRE